MVGVRRGADGLRVVTRSHFQSSNKMMKVMAMKLALDKFANVALFTCSSLQSSFSVVQYIISRPSAVNQLAMSVLDNFSMPRRPKRDQNTSPTIQRLQQLSLLVKRADSPNRRDEPLSLGHIRREHPNECIESHALGRNLGQQLLWRRKRWWR